MKFTYVGTFVQNSISPSPKGMQSVLQYLYYLGNHNTNDQGSLKSHIRFVPAAMYKYGWYKLHIYIWYMLSIMDTDKGFATH